MALSDQLARAVTALLEEALPGSSAGNTWFTDGGSEGGLLGTLERIPAALASTLPGPGRATIAAHANHVRFYLNLANRALRGEDAYATAEWKQSWALQSVDEAQWRTLQENLRHEYVRLREMVQSPAGWSEDNAALTGVLAVIAHTAYHLGAIRQMVRSVQESSNPSL